MRSTFFKAITTKMAEASFKPKSLLIDYHLAKRFELSHDWGCVLSTKKYPLFLRDYCRVAEKLWMSGYYPVVHGQKSTWMIPQTVLKALGYQGTELLRSIETLEFQDNMDVRAEIEKEIVNIRQIKTNCYPCAQLSSWGKMAVVEFAFFDALRKNIPVLHDHHDRIRQQVISGTIGLFHSEINESPLYLVFGSHAHNPRSGPCIAEQRGNMSMLPSDECKKISNFMIQRAMLRAHYPKEQISNLIEKVNPLYDAADALDIGQLLVIGIPKSIINEPQYIYHARRYGIPTGESISELVNALTTDMSAPSDLQVRIILQKEKQRDQAMFPVINVMNSDEVNAYCGQQLTLTPDIVQVFEELYYPYSILPTEEILSIIHNKSSSTMFEENNRKQYTEFRHQVERVVKQFIRQPDVSCETRNTTSETPSSVCP